MKRVLRIVTHPIILAVGFLAVLMILFVNTNCFVGAWGCSEIVDSAEVSERETMQTAMNAMMVDNDLSRVTASVSGHGGEKIRSTGAQFHETIILRDYMIQAGTRFCYRWDADGRITFQYDVDDNINCAIDAEQLFP